MTRSGYNYYRLILNTTNISSGNVLQFNLISDGNTNLANYTITPKDINCSGLSGFNLTSATAAIPDIAVEVEMPEYMYPGYPDEIYVTVKNTGIKDVGLFNLSFEVNEALVDTLTINSLPAGENTAVHFTWTPVETGNYTISITADPEDLLNESNRENNKITKNVNVTPVSIIHVPDDYQTIQEAIDHAKPHTFIYIQEGEYGISLENFPVQVKDKHHLKLIGEGKQTKIVLKASGTIVSPGPDMIRITNSSHIVLHEFAAEVSGIEESIQISGVRIVAVENSNNVTLSDLLFYHGGHTESDNNAIKLVNSSNCRISGNLLSGKERIRDLGPIGTRGIVLVRSTNNLICNNTIHRFLKCIDVQGDNNTIYFNNLYPHIMGGVHAVDSGCNNWNSTASMKYLYNGTIFRNYVGNHWGWEAAVDENRDGIADLPYSDGTLTDHYPLIEPHGLTFDLVTAGIARPSIIYAGRNNTVLATIGRKGTYPVPESLIVRLTANDTEVDSKTITVDCVQRRTVRFTWVPESAGSYDLKVHVQPENKIRELDKINNELLINVQASSTIYNYADNVGSALDLLNKTQLLGAIDGFSNSAWASLAITAAGEDPAAGEDSTIRRWRSSNNLSLIDYLRDEPKDTIIGQPSGTNPLALSRVNDFARMILVTSAVGEDPTSFGDVNYLVMLKSFYDGQQFGNPDLVEDDALAILALVSCGDNNANNVEMILNAASTIKDQQNDDMGWSSIAGKSDAKVTSLVIQALIAAGENRDSQVITDALDYLKTEQEDDGGFSDARTTSYAIQAIVAAGQDPLTYLSNGKSPLDYLIDLQQDDGSFNYTMNMSMYPGSSTIFPVPALHGAIHPVMVSTIRNDYELPDISIVDLVVENEIFVNTTTTLTIDIKNNGGIFDVALFSDGVPVGNQSVRSVWSDSITPVSFNWKPDKVGTHNLTVVVDTGDRVRELYENNNRLTHDVNVVRPDLCPFVITQPSHTFVNVTNYITLTINGTTDEYFSVTLTADGVILLNRTITGIKNNLMLPVSWRPSAIGEHTLELVVDSNEDILESNDENNVLIEVVKVEFPDLVPAAIEPIPIYVNATNKVILSVEGTAEYFNVSLIENGTEVHTLLETARCKLWSIAIMILKRQMRVIIIFHRISQSCFLILFRNR
jgi:subtilase family serine protease